MEGGWRRGRGVGGERERRGRGRGEGGSEEEIGQHHLAVLHFTYPTYSLPVVSGHRGNDA